MYNNHIMIEAYDKNPLFSRVSSVFQLKANSIKYKIIIKIKKSVVYSQKMSQEVSPLSSFFSRNVYYLLEFSKNDDKISFA